MSRQREVSDGLRCPKCGGALHRVTDSRPGEIYAFQTIRRRRPCGTCDHRETTYEVSEAWLAAVRASVRKEILTKLIEGMA